MAIPIYQKFGGIRSKINLDLYEPGSAEKNLADPFYLENSNTLVCHLMFPKYSVSILININLIIFIYYEPCLKPSSIDGIT